MKLLVVDDAAFMRMMLRNALVRGGHEVVEASNGEEALRAYAEHRPDLVTMDITMPGEDGVSVMKSLRERYPDARFVMCSAMGQQHLVVDALANGAIDFVVKPFKPERILEAVAKAEAMVAKAS